MITISCNHEHIIHLGISSLSDYYTRHIDASSTKFFISAKKDYKLMIIYRTGNNIANKELTVYIWYVHGLGEILSYGENISMSLA